MLRRWLGWTIAAIATAGAGAADDDAGSRGEFALTDVERAWVAAHPTIRVGYDPAWLPFSATGPKGEFTGIDADLLALLGRRLGVTFEFMTRGTWTEVYEAAKRGEADMLAATARTVEREAAFRFTEPYFSFPIVIVMRNDEPIFWSPLDLEGRRVVGVRDYVATIEMPREYPTLEVVLTDTVAEAMRMVSEDEADAFVTNLPNASFVAKTHGLTNLKIAGVMPERFDLRYAVRPDWPELVVLLDRAVASLTESERQAVVHPWIRVDYERVIRWDVVWKAAAAVLSVLGIVLGAVIYHNRRLARELAERIRLQGEIKEAHDQLLRLNEDKTELLQMAAHDLRGPLMGMQLAMDASLRMDAVPHADALRIVDQQVRQMTALLNNLLDVEALEHGRREFQFTRVSPAALLREALASAAASAEHKDIHLATSLAAAVPEVNADATALRQIFDNLLSNALKFSPRGSVVVVSLEQRAAFVRLEVRDQGPGVAAEETERIFGKYVRGSARPTDGEKSTGLGLSIVRQLAAGMNARVWCEARAAGGASGGLFVLVVPVAAAQPAA